MRHPLLLCLPFVLSCVIACPGEGRCDDQQDLVALRQRFLAHYTEGAPNDATIRRYIATMQADGSWPDVDYTSQQRGSWLTYQHMARVLELAQAYRCSGHPSEGSPELRTAVTKALDHWLEHDYRNPNWWYGRIGIPRLAAPVLILMDDDLPAATRAKTFELILNRSTMGMTGQNEVWVAGIAFMKGLLKEDLALMQKARDSILRELRVTTKEGIQADYSFHQHGPQQQWGNYGSSFGSDMLKWSMIFRGTRFAVSDEQQAVLANYLTEGPAWIVWRGAMDVSGCGRQVFPGAQLSKGGSILRQVRDLGRLDPNQATRVKRILDSQSPKEDNRLIGHKHYWRSDISVHRRPTWYASVKMSSPRVIGAETCNSENLMGLHLGDGATYTLCSGREYEDLFPLWNWERLPGTSCRQDASTLVPSSSRCRGGSAFVGGVSDGQHGVATMEYRRGTMEANKSWFFLDDQVVCLGAGISCDDPASVVTSIEQSRLNGPVLASESGTVRELPLGHSSVTQADWIHHANIGYRPLGPTKLNVEVGEQSGDWRKVNDQDRGARIANGRIFHLWLDHGSSPASASYAYAIHPATAPETMARIDEAPDTTLIQNSDRIQAVSLNEGRLVLAVFYAPQRLSISGRASIEVKQPCALILDRTHAAARLWVADPTHALDAIDVHLATTTQQDLHVELPRAELAGSSVSMDF